MKSEFKKSQSSISSHPTHHTLTSNQHSPIQLIELISLQLTIHILYLLRMKQSPGHIPFCSLVVFKWRRSPTRHRPASNPQPQSLIQFTFSTSPMQMNFSINWWNIRSIRWILLTHKTEEVCLSEICLIFGRSNAIDQISTLSLVDECDTSIDKMIGDHFICFMYWITK